MIEINERYKFVWWFHPTRNIQSTKLRIFFDDNKIKELLSFLIVQDVSTNQFKDILGSIYGREFTSLWSRLLSHRSDIETTRPILDTFSSVIQLVKRYKDGNEWVYTINNKSDAELFIQNPSLRKGIMQRLLLDFKIPNMYLPEYKVKIENFIIKINPSSNVRSTRIENESVLIEQLKNRLIREYHLDIDSRGYIHPYQTFNTHPFKILMKVLFKLEHKWSEDHNTTFPGIKIINLIPNILTCLNETNENINKIVDFIFENMNNDYRVMYSNWLTLSGKGKHEIDLIINRPSKFSPDCSWVKVWAEFFGLISMRAGKICPVNNLPRDIMLRLI